MRSFRYLVADVFTDVPLAGNQLAVFTDARDLDELTMQALALELGFSETAFVLPPLAGGHARMRIFTPRAELRFAGHPVLGTAFALASPLQLGTIVLETAAGLVPVELTRDESGRTVFGRMAQPVPSVEPFGPERELLAALGVRGSVLPVELYDNGVPHVYVALPDEGSVAALEPDVRALGSFDVVGVNVFAGSGTRWKLRMFAPGAGVDEDAATGSAAGPLALHLCRHGLLRWGEEIVVSQGEELGRPSTLHARASRTNGEVSVEVGGAAVVVARGEFRLP